MSLDSSGLGFFFSKNKGDVTQYGKNVLEVHLSAQNPLVANSYDLPAFDSLEEAKQYSQALQDKGYDGIYLKDAGYAIVFNSNQAKLTSNIEPTDSEDIRFSVGNTASSSGVAIGINTLNRVVDRIIKRFPVQTSRDAVIIADRFSDLPVAIQEYATKQGYDNNDTNDRIRGVAYQGKIYLVHENIYSELEVEETLLHERIHQILRGKFSDTQGKQLIAYLNTLYEKMGKTGGMITLANRGGISFESARKQALKMPQGLARNAFLVDEFLAEAEGRRAYENLPERALRALREFYGQVREWLANNGFTVLAKSMHSESFDAADLAFLLKTIRTQSVMGQDGAIRFHRAWHGSPHDHNKFDSAKIGTGEGAQAYGYGHYFTGAKEVAEYYRDTLSSLESQINLSLEPVKLAFLMGDIDRAIRLAKSSITKGKTSEAREIAREDLFTLNQIKSGKITFTNGKLYEVELAPTEDEYLLWDKPLSEQSAKVLSALYKAGVIYDVDIDTETLPVLSTDRFMQDPKGGRLYDALGGFRGDTLRNDGVSGRTGQKNKEASEYLRSLGIRGIKYLDGSSRSEGDGNYNYVIFDDMDIEIVAKYRKAIGDQKAKGISVSEAQKIADNFMRDYNGHIPLQVIVVNQQEDIYGPHNSIEQSGQVIKGAYHAKSRKLVLVAANLQGELDARETLRHEVLVHFGLNTFKSVDKRNLLWKIVNSKSHKSLKDAWTRIDELYPELSELKKAEEVFAHVAESKQGFLGSIRNFIYVWLNKSLRAIGLINAPVTTPELRELVRSIAKGIRNGQRTQQTFPVSDDAQFRLTDFFTGEQRSPSSLADVDTMLATGRPIQNKIGWQYWFDKATTAFVDSTRPFERFISDTFNDEQASRLVGAADRALGMKAAFEKKAMNLFGRDISDGVRAIVKATGMEYQTAKYLAENNWNQSLRYPHKTYFKLNRLQ